MLPNVFNDYQILTSFFNFKDSFIPITNSKVFESSFFINRLWKSALKLLYFVCPTITNLARMIFQNLRLLRNRLVEVYKNCWIVSVKKKFLCWYFHKWIYSIVTWEEVLRIIKVLNSKSFEIMNYELIVWVTNK